MHLLIGGRGLVGSAIRAELAARNHRFIATSRHHTLDGDEWFLDLADMPDLGKLRFPRPDVMYLVAAMPGFAQCEGNRTSYHVNVDAPIALARWFAGHGTFTVFISSDCVENLGGTAYARQKAQVESYMHTIDAAIIRPSKILPSHAAEFARMVVDVGEQKFVGVIRWQAGERSFQKQRAA